MLLGEGKGNVITSDFSVPSLEQSSKDAKNAYSEIRDHFLTRIEAPGVSESGSFASLTRL